MIRMLFVTVILPLPATADEEVTIVTQRVAALSGRDLPTTL